MSTIDSTSDRAPGEAASVLIWIDAEQAVLVRWNGEPRILRVTSDVPPRHEATGHVRHDPMTRHGGGGAAQDKISRDREGHIRSFVEAVAAAIEPAEDVEILGPGGLRDELHHLISSGDRRRGSRRRLATTPSGPLTDRQLVARLRERIGDAPPRVHRGPA